MRVLVATDAWHPQVNGVVRTYERLAPEAPKLGFEVSFLSPAQFRTLPCPTYPRSDWRLPARGRSRGPSRERAPISSTSPRRDRWGT